MKFPFNFYLLFIVLVPLACSGKRDASDHKFDGKEVSESLGPQTITRNIIETRNGDIWIAAFDGVFKYDGKKYHHTTDGISDARFFSVLEDRNGSIWLSTVGSGVYRYDGIGFQNFRTSDGLADDRVCDIYEDADSNIWFATEAGISRFDGQSFSNFKERDGLPNSNINSIIQDISGKFWIGTRDSAFTYDGNAFSILKYYGEPFINIRSIVEDREGNVWLAGQFGLWRFDGTAYKKITDNLHGNIYEDKEGNIWTSSQNTENLRWAISRYNVESLSDGTPKVSIRHSEHEGNKGMTFGLLQDNHNTIWVGALDGVYQIDVESVFD